MKSLGGRLREARTLRGMSQSELARQIGGSPNQMSMVESGQSGMSTRTLRAAASALNVSADFLLGLIEVPASTRDLVHSVQEKQATILDMQSGSREFQPSDYVTYIELMDIRTGAGPGAIVYGEGVKAMIEFPEKWLRDRGLKASECRVISVVGESMEPTLADGSQILIDMRSHERRHGRIYVIESDNELVVKRMVRDPETGYLLASDNPDKRAFPTEPWPRGARVIGEVKWHGQSFLKEKPSRETPGRSTPPAGSGSNAPGGEPATTGGTGREAPEGE